MQEREVRQFTDIGQGVADAARQQAQAFAQMRESLKRLAARLNEHWRWNARLQRKLALARARSERGGNGSDALDPLWQSAVCSAWLHESCPDRGLGVLGCSCGCHR